MTTQEKQETLGVAPDKLASPLPPGWQMRMSTKRNQPYFYHISNPQATQWNEPCWDAEVARVYALAAIGTSTGSRDLRSLQNWIKNCLMFCWIWGSHHPVAKLLDIACGKGGDVGKIPAEIQYVGIDVCTRSIEEARRRHPSRSFHQGSFNTDSLCEKVGNDFSGAICMFALHYAQDLTNVLKNIRACLVRGAPFLCVVLDEQEVRRTPCGRGDLKLRLEDVGGRTRAWVQMNGTIQDELPEWILTHEEIVQAASNAQFQVEEHQTLVQAMASFGIGKFMESDDRDGIARRNALYAIRDRYYFQDSGNWGTEAWFFADIYKAVLLRAT